MAETILIVDDSKMSRTLSKLALEGKGYTLVEAEDGDEALALIKNEPPDLVLLDIVMPKRNGFETCKAIKDNPETKHIPIIFLSALEEFPAKKEGFEMGADDYLVKPANPEELAIRVDILLKVKQEHDIMARKASDMSDVYGGLLEDQKKIIEKEKELVLQQVHVSLHHEIRNPLTSILIGAQILSAKFSADAPEKKMLSEIESCAKRIRDTMDTLGNLKGIVVDAYVQGTNMINLKK